MARDRVRASCSHRLLMSECCGYGRKTDAPTPRCSKIQVFDHHPCLMEAVVDSFDPVSKPFFIYDNYHDIVRIRSLAFLSSMTSGSL
jgi:hypothetical protein